MLFQIKARFTGLVQVEVEINVRSDASERVKLGAAVKAAILGGAYLGGADLRGAGLGGADLRGAYLRGAGLGGADLRGADLGGADLRGADLGGADLRGADLRGAGLGGADLGEKIGKVSKLIARATRSDGHEGFAFVNETGELWIVGGCKTLTVPQFREHVASEYAGTPKAVEMTDMLDYFEKRFAAES